MYIIFFLDVFIPSVLKMEIDKRNLHRMDLPETVIVGYNLLENLTNIYENIKSNVGRAFLITGPNVFKKIKKRLDEKLLNLSVIEFAYEATWSEIKRVLDTVLRNKEKINLIIGLGGGKVIDVAKMVAFKSNKNFVSIPTTASHDGIASQFVSIRGGDRAHSYSTKPPTAVIVDMNVILTAPRRLIASGVGDAIAKLTAVKDWRLAHDKIGEYYGEYAANLSLLGAKLVIENAEGIGCGDEDSIRTLVEALISDGVAAGIAGSSRPCSGSEHLFSHALDLYGKYQALHGEQVGVGTIIMSYLHGLDYQKIIDTLRKVRAPTNYRELNVNKNDIIMALIKAKSIRPDRYTILNEVEITEDLAVAITKKLGII